jgi:hypothetical protein
MEKFSTEVLDIGSLKLSVKFGKTLNEGILDWDPL